MAEGAQYTAESETSFADAAQQAFKQVQGDPSREGIAEARVVDLRLSKGGFVGRVMFRVTIEQVEPGSGGDGKPE